MVRLATDPPTRAHGLLAPAPIRRRRLASRPVNEGQETLFSLEESFGETSRERLAGHDFARLPVLAPGKEAPSCPLAGAAPRACPFGGACHTCPVSLQAKVVGGGNEDAYEEEADRVAEAVMEAAEQPAESRGSALCPPLSSPGRLLQRRPERGRRRAEAPPRLLQDCATWPSASNLGTVVSSAGTLASQAVSGLKALVSHWGTPGTSPLEQAAVMGLRRGFNIEPDKSDWVPLGIATADEVAALEARDRPAADTILANYRQIAADAPHYQGAPACTRTLVSGSPCLGCVAAEHGRCRNGALAFVIPEMIGQPSSPILFCPAFFTSNVGEMAACFLHELAHLQPFAASDRIDDIRYYGCPVAPIDPGGRGLRDPGEFIRIADSYRCFVETQRESRGFFEERQREQQRAREALPAPAETSPAEPGH